MPRFTRENTIEEKRRMRNERNKKKRLLKVSKKREAKEIRRKQERAAYSRAKELARMYYDKWRQLGRQTKSRTLNNTKQIDKEAKSVPCLTKYPNVNLIDPAELLPINGKTIVLGEGSYGRCLLKNFGRLEIAVVEKQSLMHDTRAMLKEAQIMQALTHTKIPTIMGVQLQKKPISLILEFKGEQDTSVTISKLLSCEGDHETVQNVQTLLTKNDWLIISHDLTEALSHIHSKGFLHCDLKPNNVLVSNKHGYIIDFGKACDSLYPPAKKYSTVYSHIAPEVLNGSPCSKPSDIFSLGKIFFKVGVKQDIPLLITTAEKCLDASPLNIDISKDCLPLPP